MWSYNPSIILLDRGGGGGLGILLRTTKQGWADHGLIETTITGYNIVCLTTSSRMQVKKY